MEMSMDRQMRSEKFGIGMGAIGLAGSAYLGKVGCISTTGSVVGMVISGVVLTVNVAKLINDKRMMKDVTKLINRKSL